MEKKINIEMSPNAVAEILWDMDPVELLEVIAQLVKIAGYRDLEYQLEQVLPFMDDRCKRILRTILEA